MICCPLRLPHLPVLVDSNCTECILKTQPETELSKEESLSQLFGLLSIAEAAGSNLRRTPSKWLPAKKHLIEFGDYTIENEEDTIKDETGISRLEEPMNEKQRNSKEQKGAGRLSRDTIGELDGGLEVVEMLHDNILKERETDFEVRLGTTAEPFVVVETIDGVPWEDFI